MKKKKKRHKVWVCWLWYTYITHTNKNSLIMANVYKWTTTFPKRQICIIENPLCFHIDFCTVFIAVCPSHIHTPSDSWTAFLLFIKNTIIWQFLVFKSFFMQMLPTHVSLLINNMCFIFNFINISPKIAVIASLLKGTAGKDLMKEQRKPFSTLTQKALERIVFLDWIWKTHSIWKKIIQSLMYLLQTPNID